MKLWFKLKLYITRKLWPKSVFVYNKEEDIISTTHADINFKSCCINHGVGGSLERFMYNHVDTSKVCLTGLYITSLDTQKKDSIALQHYEEVAILTRLMASIDKPIMDKFLKSAYAEDEK